MVLDRYRVAADALLTPAAKRLQTVNPNNISWAAFLAALGAGAGFFMGGPWLLGAGAALLLGSAYLDALDGKVAKMTQRASARGDFLDHVLDRYADIFMLGGIAFGGLYCQLWIGTLAIVGVLLTSYMGTQAQAVGQGRQYRGILGRADRLVLLFGGTIVQLIVAPAGSVVWGLRPLLFQPLEWVMVVFAILGNATAVQRAILVWRGFAA